MANIAKEGYRKNALAPYEGVPMKKPVFVSIQAGTPTEAVHRREHWLSLLWFGSIFLAIEILLLMYVLTLDHFGPKERRQR
jgi:hypothetical protein